MKNRLAQLSTYIAENNLDAMYISSYENYRYYSGFTGSNCHLIVTHDKRFIITDGRYFSQAKQQAGEYELVEQRRSAKDAIARVIEDNGIKRIGYEFVSDLGFVEQTGYVGFLWLFHDFRADCLSSSARNWLV